ncbi:MAG: hypothetical protein K8I82_13460 [Anaerolineae bacterium]|nr:hypothetical protein [Anaerolineae bacterium]
MGRRPSQRFGTSGGVGQRRFPFRQAFRRFGSSSDEESGSPKKPKKKIKKTSRDRPNKRL